MANPITIRLIIQFLELYGSTNTSQKSLQDHLLISENTAKNLRLGRSSWVNENLWSKNAKEEVKAVFDRISASAQNYNNHHRLMQHLNSREVAFDKYLNRNLIESPWLSELFKPLFCSSQTFNMPTFTFFLRNYIYKQLLAIASEKTFDCHSELVIFMQKKEVHEDIIADFRKIYCADLNAIAHFLSYKAFSCNFNDKKPTASAMTKHETCDQSTPTLMFPFYIDSIYVNMIYEQLLAYTENELPLPSIPNGFFSQTSIDINGRPIKEQPFSDHWKLLMIIHLINNSSLHPIHIYNCLQHQPQKNLVFVEGIFRLTGIYDITDNLIDNAAYVSDKHHLYWRLEYVNTGVDNTDFSKLQNDRYVCSYARGRDTIYQISMNLSGDKFILSYRHITHLVKRFGTFKLKVLGHLIRDSQDPTTLSIKPLAVFHDS